MGFRTGAFAKVWEVKPYSDTSTTIRISISKKNRSTGEYEEEFSGFARAIGTAAAKKAACLKAGDRIKLGDVDMTNKYDEEKKVTYWNAKIFSFEMADASATTQSAAAKTEPQPTVDSGEVDDARLPF